MAYRNADIVKRRAYERQPQLQVQRQKFAQVLASLLYNDPASVAFVDESQFSSWMVQKKSWSVEGHPNQHVTNSKRWATCVFGAIGLCVTDLACYKLLPRNNAENFLKFLRHLKACVTVEKPILVLDNFSGHKAESVQDYLHRHFRPLYLPAYSCTFSSIEWVWHHGKQRFRKQQLGVNQAQGQQEFEADVLAALPTSQTCPEATMMGLLDSNRVALKKFLDLALAAQEDSQAPRDADQELLSKLQVGIPDSEATDGKILNE